MKRKSVVTTLLCLALLGLLLAAGPASATSVSAVQGVFQGFLDFGEPTVLPDGTEYTPDVVMPTLFYKASGPDGWRLLGWNIVYADVWVPPTGDNIHRGVTVWVTTDPATFWDPELSFWDNIQGRTDVIWSGTWDGRTRNKRNHTGTMDLMGWPDSVNDGWTAEVTLNAGQFDVANVNSGQYVDTPWNAVARLTAPSP